MSNIDVDKYIGIMIKESTKVSKDRDLRVKKELNNLKREVWNQALQFANEHALVDMIVKNIVVETDVFIDTGETTYSVNSESILKHKK